VKRFDALCVWTAWCERGEKKEMERVKWGMGRERRRIPGTHDMILRRVRSGE